MSRSEFKKIRELKTQFNDDGQPFWTDTVKKNVKFQVSFTVTFEAGGPFLTLKITLFGIKVVKRKWKLGKDKEKVTMYVGTK